MSSLRSLGTAQGEDLSRSGALRSSFRPVCNDDARPKRSVPMRQQDEVQEVLPGDGRLGAAPLEWQLPRDCHQTHRPRQEHRVCESSFRDPSTRRASPQGQLAGHQTSDVPACRPANIRISGHTLAERRGPRSSSHVAAGTTECFVRWELPLAVIGPRHRPPLAVLRHDIGGRPCSTSDVVTGAVQPNHQSR